MSVAIFLVIAAAGGLASSLLAPSRPSWALAAGLAASVAAVVAALAIHRGDSITLGPTVVVASDTVRTVAAAWSVSGLLLGIVDALTVASGVVCGPALLGVAAAVAALSLTDASASFAVLVAGGASAVVLPALRAGRPETSDVSPASRAFRFVVLASLIGVGIVTWGASPVGPLARPGVAVDPAAEAAIGLGLLAAVAAVILRSGAIPAHVWAARYVEVVPATVVPSLLGWGSAAFTLVALGWTDATFGPSTASLGLERAVVAIVAAGCIVFGGLAAWLHDDVEHVLGYSIVQDAGVVLLAFAWLSPTAAPAARDWAIAAAAAKSGFAAWVAAVRWTFGAHRIPDLSGWAVRSPLLALAFGIVALAAIGFPGMAAFAARGGLTAGAIGGIGGGIVLVAAFAPVLYLGRILVIGFGRPSAAVRDAPSTRPQVRIGRTSGWSRRLSVAHLADAVRSVPSLAAANRAALAALAVLALAVVGLGVAAVGVGGGVGATAVGSITGG